MNLQNILSITEARKNLFKIADQAQKNSTKFLLTKRGKPKAVVMSAGEFDSWQETLEIMKDFPDLNKDIKKFEKDFKNNKLHNYTTLEEILAKDGLTLISKNGRENAISNKIQTKGRKRARKITAKK
ncbi:MAG: type II toxin-antitoxin system Phd/YefM family antitoxin [Patescibacteria group bacterium]|nr:type II toxin-antitoxin system Phd/YefM family antitoxin [Patescibacteria group bacterium]